MKRILAMLLALMLTVCGALTAYADGTNQPPEPPEGGFPGGTPPEPPEGGMPGGPGGPGGFGGGTPPGGGSASFEYAAATEITGATESAGRTYASETADESALIVNTSDAVTITDPTVTKTGSSDGGDSCNFYGLNAAVLVMGGSTPRSQAAPSLPTRTAPTVSSPTAATAAGTARRVTGPRSSSQTP